MTAPDPTSLSVLIIDDDPSLREVLVAYLDDRGFRVHGERSGEAGLGALEREPFDIVLTDLRMPGMDGIEVVRRVKARRPEAEAIVLTGFATIENGVEAMREGAFDFLLKPVKVEQLDAVLAKCGEWIHHKRSHAELEEVNRKLLEVNRLKERFLAVADHELRTPVTVLDGMLQLLNRQKDELPERLHGRVASLCQVSRRLAQLVRDIHDIVQARTHEFSVQLDRATVAELSAGVQLDFEMARFDRDLNLELEVQLPEATRFLADTRRLRQAVTELIQNAVKATPDGGRVEVAIFAAEHPEGKRLCVAVEDTGVGVPEDQKQKIFDVLHGVGDELHHHSSKLAYLGGGLGLGLSIALEIARAHGGGIDLHSEAAAGSLFTLWIPIS